MADEAELYPPEFETALRENRLRFPHCRSCDRFHWYPMDLCPHCLSAEVEWRQTSGRGFVFTTSTVAHAFTREWDGAVPYTVALVEFEDAPGIRLVAQVLETEPGSTTVGMPVEAVFCKDEARPRVVFRPLLPSRENKQSLVLESVIK